MTTTTNEWPPLATPNSSDDVQSRAPDMFILFYFIALLMTRITYRFTTLTANKWPPTSNTSHDEQRGSRHDEFLVFLFSVFFFIYFTNLYLQLDTTPGQGAATTGEAANTKLLRQTTTTQPPPRRQRRPRPRPLTGRSAWKGAQTMKLLFGPWGFFSFLFLFHHLMFLFILSFLITL
jgi:hypothetical protein